MIVERNIPTSPTLVYGVVQVSSRSHRFRILNAQVSKKNGRNQTIIAGFMRLCYCCSVNLNAVFCLTEDVIHHRFRLQQNNLTKTEYRKIDPNRSWEVKADSHVFLFCIGRAEIKHVFGWCTGL